MNRRYIIMIAIGLAIIAPTAWRRCSATSEREAVVKEKSMAFANANNAPIAFYGRVVDQDGKPLQGVAVDYQVTAIPLIPIPWGPDKTMEGSRVTDQNGLFAVDGEQGTSFDVYSLRKSGYRESGYYEQGHARYEPHDSQRHVPRRDKPVEFVLIRSDLPRAEKMFDQRLRLNWSGGSTTEDLGPDIGKLEFTASRSGRDANDTMKKFEWVVIMRATGFTMTKLPGANVRIAPLTGYVPNGRSGFSPDEKTWSSVVDESYAIRTEKGLYGLMELTIYGSREDSGVGGRITVYLNKDGSRNIDHE